MRTKRALGAAKESIGQVLPGGALMATASLDNDHIAAELSHSPSRTKGKREEAAVNKRST